MMSHEYFSRHKTGFAQPARTGQDSVTVHSLILSRGKNPAPDFCL